MSRYTGPKLKITRRLGTLPGFTQKVSNRTKTPGQHGVEISSDSETTSSSNYVRRLKEKQKLRFNYGISESKLLSYVNKAKKKQGSKGVLLLQMLELRLDNIVFKLGFAPTIRASRQMVNHGHFLVNDQKVNIPSFQCTVGDKISLSPRSKFSQTLELEQTSLPNYLDCVGNEKGTQRYGILKQLPTRMDIDLAINELFVIEYYSR